MGVESADEFPDPLDRIQIGTVGRQEIETEGIPVFPEPGLQGSCVMPASIVGHNYDPSPLPLVPQNLAQEYQERFPGKRIDRETRHPAILHPNRPEDAYALSSRSM